MAARAKDQGLIQAVCPACGEGRVRVCGTLDFLADFPPGMRLVRCRRCGCERIDPHPGPGRMARHYDGAYYEEGYLPHLARRRADFQARLAELERFAPVRRARRAGRTPACLDVGAGLGLFVAEAAAAGYRATGLEPSAAARELARQVLGVELLADWPPAGPPLDLITLWDVLGHVEDPAGLLTRARERLDPGGGLVVKLPNFRSSWHRIRTRMSLRRRANLLHAPTVIWRFHRQSALHLLRASGFEPEQVITLQEPDLTPLTPRWWVARRITSALDGLTDNRQEMVIHAAAR